MSCSRSDCGSIMCDTYVDGIGYVCFSCQNEFKEYLQAEGINPQTEGEIHKALKLFMETEKGQFDKGKEMSVDHFFKNYTRE